MINIKSGIDFPFAFAFKADDGTVATGLTVATTLYDLTAGTNSSLGNMTEVAVGGYKDTIPTASLVTGHTYMIYADGSASAGASYRYQYMFIAVDFGSTKAIADNIDTINTAITDVDFTLIDQAISLAGSGDGSTRYVFKLTETDSQEPLVGIYLWLSTSSSPNVSNKTAKKRTNDFGNTTWNIDTGVTYYVWSDYSDNYIKTFTI